MQSIASVLKYFWFLFKLYIWLHNTFRYIVTFDQASTLKLNEILRPDLLSLRFHDTEVNHVQCLWMRVKSQMNDFLFGKSNEVYWDCEKVKIPFENLDEVPLIMFLSAYEHPTEGYDFLFIVINNFVSIYNNFVLRILNGKSKVNEKIVRPRLLLQGSPGDIVMKNLDWMKKDQLGSLVESFRIFESDKFDCEGLENEILNRLSSCDFIIASPMKHLRCKHLFRFENENVIFDEQKRQVLKSSQGFCFANISDYRLFEDCHHELQRLNINVEHDECMIYDYVTKFHKFDYDALRGTLEGIRVVFQKLTKPHFDSFGEALTDLGLASQEVDLADLFEDLGFTGLSRLQAKYIIALNLSQMIQLVHYVGYQIASEGYTYASLPLSMIIPIVKSDRAILRTRILKMEEEGVAQLIYVFQTDIMCFYEKVIREHSATSNESLKYFLERSSFCDDETDLIHSMLPEGITVRNYVPLQLMLNQLRLHFLAQDQVENTEFTDHNDSNNIFSNPRRGNFWLWSSSRQETDVPENLMFDEDSSEADSISSWLNEADIDMKLWFEKSIEQYEIDSLESNDSKGNELQIGIQTNTS